nr:MAG TPA: zinc finger Ran-binding domain-containing protein [Caudoviricetes sp.]
MAQEGWICPRCGKVNAPWVAQCFCNRNIQILPKVGAPYYEGCQATCNTSKIINEQRKNKISY